MTVHSSSINERKVYYGALIKIFLSNMQEAAKYIELVKYDTENILKSRQNDKLEISLEHIKYTQSIIYGNTSIIFFKWKIKRFNYYYIYIFTNKIIIVLILNKSQFQNIEFVIFNNKLLSFVNIINRFYYY